MDKNNNHSLKEIEVLYKPILSMRILLTIILVAPVLNLMLNNNSTAFIEVLIADFSLILIAVIWFSYIIKIRKYRSEAIKFYYELINSK
ncbi:MAG: hypothetical protein ABRQ27_10285 [Clostridiaceae bacterium]